MSHNKEEEKLKTLLNSMPRIEDEQSKDELYAKISSRVEQKERPSIKRRRFSWVFPSLGTIGVITLFVLIFQNSPINFNGNYESLEESSGYDMASDEDRESTEEDREGTDGDTAENKINSFGEESEPEMDAIEESAEGEISMADVAPNSHIVTATRPNTTMVQLAVTETNIQNVIPITLIDGDGNRDVNEYYNELESFIDLSELGVKSIIPEGLTFDIDESENQVTMHVSEDFKFPDGSSYPNIFVNALSIMFQPFEIDAVSIGSTDNSESLFGPIVPNDDQIQLNDFANNGYKLYQSSEKLSELLVPIQGDFASLEEAMIEMQTSEPEFNLKATVPTDISFTVEENDNTVIVTMDESEIFGDPQQTINMVEAILMTAKSFGFVEVQFQLPILTAGPYLFDNPIPIPVGVNPIELNN
ncbi:hypothetical protein NC661_00510 [Aquibacillus koreensis]|uniref:GerMN domain-containing protein n=1 Tax=Aquibacillus koreensis TaxID=279446 RepID=A0A9X3WI80_9BACI|nr:hypothetical protein [Aquibacillus koreensis]MCT2537420.1 hypothetical protein [Aquibacillus koreensis]MDC3418866.1 hypothetical protein [Aquibacillus koreensis]